jgi:hypothetical protein
MTRNEPDELLAGARCSDRCMHPLYPRLQDALLIRKRELCA